MAKRNLFAGKLIFLLLNFTAEFTLLSNPDTVITTCLKVLLYSEFTLLSNHERCVIAGGLVLLYSEFTLLSNCKPAPLPNRKCFTVFWIYTTLKLTFLRLCLAISFTVFWIYTTLKPRVWRDHIRSSFTVFWIYTTLKLA